MLPQSGQPVEYRTFSYIRISGQRYNHAIVFHTYLSFCRKAAIDNLLVTYEMVKAVVPARNSFLVVKPGKIQKSAICLLFLKARPGI